jgi:hypothetical protein
MDRAWDVKMVEEVRRAHTVAYANSTVTHPESKRTSRAARGGLPIDDSERIFNRLPVRPPTLGSTRPDGDGHARCDHPQPVRKQLDRGKQSLTLARSIEGACR